MFTNELEKAATEFGIGLSGQQINHFQLYCKILIEWNKKINLTAITDEKEIITKHIIDSLSVWNDNMYLKNGKLIDVGTGAGFPGIPLKIFRPELQVTLLDSLGKRVRFLQEAVKALGLQQVECIHGRAEDLAGDKRYREQFDLAVSRAVARLSVLAEYCIPFVRPGGFFAALKGMRYAEECREAERAVRTLGGGSMDCRPVKLPGIDDRRAIVTVKKERLTPKDYPRKAGIPERKPL